MPDLTIPWLRIVFFRPGIGSKAADVWIFLERSRSHNHHSFLFQFCLSSHRAAENRTSGSLLRWSGHPVEKKSVRNEKPDRHPPLNPTPFRRGSKADVKIRNVFQTKFFWVTWNCQSRRRGIWFSELICLVFQENLIDNDHDFKFIAFTISWNL